MADIYDNKLIPHEILEQYDALLDKFALNCSAPYATICAWCYKPTISYHKRRKFCCRNCSQHYRRNKEYDLYPKVTVCHNPACRVPFRPNTIRQIYCSDPCRRQANKIKHKALALNSIINNV